MTSTINSLQKHGHSNFNLLQLCSRLFHQGYSPSASSIVLSLICIATLIRSVKPLCRKTTKKTTKKRLRKFTESAWEAHKNSVRPPQKMQITHVVALQTLQTYCVMNAWLSGILGHCLYSSISIFVHMSDFLFIGGKSPYLTRYSTYRGELVSSVIKIVRSSKKLRKFKEGKNTMDLSSQTLTVSHSDGEMASKIIPSITMGVGRKLFSEFSVTATQKRLLIPSPNSHRTWNFLSSRRRNPSENSMVIQTNSEISKRQLNLSFIRAITQLCKEVTSNRTAKAGMSTSLILPKCPQLLNWLHKQSSTRIADMRQSSWSLSPNVSPAMHATGGSPPAKPASYRIAGVQPHQVVVLLARSKCLFGEC